MAAPSGDDVARATRLLGAAPRVLAMTTGAGEAATASPPIMKLEERERGVGMKAPPLPEAACETASGVFERGEEGLRDG